MQVHNFLRKSPQIRKTFTMTDVFSGRCKNRDRSAKQKQSQLRLFLSANSLEHLGKQGKR
mgnify:CR=1 FL=1